MKFKVLSKEPERKLVGVIPAAGNRLVINNKGGKGNLAVLQNGRIRDYSGSISTLEELCISLFDHTPVYEGDVVEVTF